MMDMRPVRMTFFSFYKEVSKMFFICFCIGGLLIFVCGLAFHSLFWLLDLLISFSVGFVLIFRKPEVRSEFRGDN